MTKEEAQAALDRRAAVAVIAGAALGELPLLWLIREALQDYNDAIDGNRGFAFVDGRAAELLKAGGHTLVLVPYNGSRLLVEEDDFGSIVRSHETPNAALVLHDAVKNDPVSAEELLVKIESATKKGLR